MRILITGSQGYIGSALVPFLQRAGHGVTGLDIGYYECCTMGAAPNGYPVIQKDIREVEPRDLLGIDAVIHLAALSNDPLGNLNPNLTYDINYRGTLRVARAAKAAGVRRFVFSSSCSTYGAASPDQEVVESAAFNPVTPYGVSKVRAEQGLARLVSTDFSPTYLRNATAYGFAPSLRADLVVNNLMGWALTTGEVMIKSDGTPWRPLVHVEDICRAFLAVLETPREKVHDQAFNVGRVGENYQIRDIAEMVQAQAPGSNIQFAENAGPDLRCYRVNFEKIARTLENFEPRWTVREGVAELDDAYRKHGLRLSDLEGSRYMRIHAIRGLIESGRLDERLRWIAQPEMSQPALNAGA